MVQPSANSGAFGISRSLPRAAPPSTQATIVSISCCERRGSFLKTPIGESADQGGISRLVTFCRIARAHGRVSSYVTSDIGANIDGRWHSTQLLYRMGATSFA